MSLSSTLAAKQIFINMLNYCEYLKVFSGFFSLQVLKQLPAKEEKVDYCSMSEKQQVLYQTLFKKLKASVNGESKLTTVHITVFLSTSN